MRKIEVKFKKLSEDAKIFEKATSGSAGYDVFSNEDNAIYPGEVKLIKTGISVELPEGFEMQIRPRSGLALKNGITVLNTPGTVDSDYRGEVGVILINHGVDIFKIKKGDRIAQAIFNHVYDVDCVEVNSLSETSRGVGGFGSTGVK